MASDPRQPRSPAWRLVAPIGRMTLGPAPHGHPHLRGVAHLWAFLISVAAGIVLTIEASSERAQLAAIVYCTTVACMFGASGIYHRVAWTGRAHRVWRRIDHSTIFLTISGSFTAYWILILPHTAATDSMLAVIWIGAAAGVVSKLFWLDAPRSLSTTVYVLLGLSGLVALPALLNVASWQVVSLTLLGAALHILGAVVYATERPNVFPTVFGYHEFFHLLVTLGIACHFAVVAHYVLR